MRLKASRYKSGRPVVKQGCLVLPATESTGSNTIELGSPRWYAWLAENRTLVFEGQTGRLSAHSEKRRGLDDWYAYRRRGGKLSKLYLGKVQDLTLARLEQANRQLAGPGLAPASGPVQAEAWGVPLSGVV